MLLLCPSVLTGYGLLAPAQYLRRAGEADVGSAQLFSHLHPAQVLITHECVPPQVEREASWKTGREEGGMKSGSREEGDGKRTGRNEDMRQEGRHKEKRYDQREAS